jgi:hypothetical protein
LQELKDGVGLDAPIGQHGDPVVVKYRGVLGHECGDVAHGLAVEQARAGEGLEIPGKLDRPEGRVEDVGCADLVSEVLGHEVLGAHVVRLGDVACDARSGLSCLGFGGGAFLPAQLGALDH